MWAEEDINVPKVRQTCLGELSGIYSPESEMGLQYVLLVCVLVAIFLTYLIRVYPLGLTMHSEGCSWLQPCPLPL